MKYIGIFLYFAVNTYCIYEYNVKVCQLKFFAIGKKKEIPFYNLLTSYKS
jgi:hypothetical protein